MANQSFSIADLQNLINQTEEENKNKPSAPIRPVPMTRQSMYGDTTREQELKSDITDPFQVMEEELQRQQDIESGLPVQPTAREQLQEVQQEKELRYQRARGVGKEARRLQQLKALPEERVTPELDAEMRMLQQRIEEAPTTVTSPEGTEVVIPRPSANILTNTLEKAGRDALRGFAGIYGMINQDMTAEEGQELIAEVRDESTGVNVASEILQLAAGGAGGALAIAKGLGKIAKVAPKIKNVLAGVVGAPAGEALVATTGTETLMRDEGDDVLESKLKVLAEGMMFGGGVAATGKALTSIAEISVLSRVLKALPLALMGDRKRSEELVGDTIGDLVAIADEAKTPEAKAKALSDLRQRMKEGFELQIPDVDYEDYLAGKVELPEGSWQPTLGGVSGSNILGGIEGGLRRQGAVVEFSGIGQRQAEAIKKGAEQVREDIVPALAGREVQPTAVQRAEQLGTEAMEEVASTVRAPLQPLEAKRNELQILLSDAETEITERLGSQADSFESAVAKSDNLRAKNASAEQATEVIKDTYLNARSAKNQNYETYLEDASEITIPANTFATNLRDAFRPEEIGNLAQMVASDNRATARTLRQIDTQNAMLRSAIAEEQQKQFEKLMARVPEDLKTDPAQIRAVREQAAANIDIDAIKESIEWQDIKLDNVEGLLQSVNSVLTQTTDVAQIGGLKSLKDALESMITDTLQGSPEVLARRNEAINYFQDFQNIYRNTTAGGVTSKFRFGDKISDQQFTEAIDGITSTLNKAKTDNASMQFITNLRNTMEPEQAARFNQTLNEFYRSDILSQLPRPQDLLAKGTPQTAAEGFSKALTNALDKNPNLKDTAPEVFQEFETYLNGLNAAKGSAKDSSTALRQLDKDLMTRAKELESTVPFKEYGAKVETNSSVNLARKLLEDPDAVKVFPQIWETAGQAGRVGADGLTDTQRKIKSTIGVGMVDLLTSKTSKADLDKLYENNPAFDIVFPKDSASRKVFNTLFERLQAIQKTKLRATGTDLASGNVESVGQIVSELINYAAGPISKEGRRSKILARTFFSLAGGPEQAKKVLADTFTDLRVADRLLREAEQRARMTGEPVEKALNSVTNSYLLFSIGVNSVDEFNRQVSTIALEEDTEGAFSTQ